MRGDGRELYFIAAIMCLCLLTISRYEPHCARMQFVLPSNLPGDNYDVQVASVDANGRVSHIW